MGGGSSVLGAGRRSVGPSGVVSDVRVPHQSRGPCTQSRHACSPRRAHVDIEHPSSRNHTSDQLADTVRPSAVSLGPAVDAAGVYWADGLIWSQKASRASHLPWRSEKIGPGWTPLSAARRYGEGAIAASVGFLGRLAGQRLVEAHPLIGGNGDLHDGPCRVAP